MRRVLALPLVLVGFAQTLSAQDVAVPGSLPADPPVPMMVPPTPPPGYAPIPRGDPIAADPLERRLGTPFARPTEAGGQPARTFNENFDGDFGGVYYRRIVVVGAGQPRVVGFSQRVVGFTPTTSQVTQLDNLGRPVTVRTVTNTTTNNPIVVTDPVVSTEGTQRVVRLALAARYSGVLITDNDNPRPQDRVYGGYNFYDNLGSSLNPGLGGTSLQRQLAGFEKTFLGGDASFGVRLPFVQQYGPAGYNSQDVSDLTLIGKYALFNDRETGNLWSAGLALTVPTGSGDAIVADGTNAPHSFLFQPWTGFVRTFDRGYVQGITSLVVPTDHRDPTLWNNSLAAGYYVYRAGPDRVLSAIVPTAEIHVRTPLSNRDPNGVAYLMDQVNLTGGIHFRFNRAVLSGAVCVPVVGPRPWAVEAMTFLNFYF